MEHFKEYLTYAPFVAQMDNNLHTYVLTMPNLDAMGHQRVGTLASFQFELEYQKGTDNRAVDTLSWVPISHSQQTKAKANKGLLEEHEHLSQEARVQAVKLEPVHMVDWEQAQEADVALAISGSISGRACCHPGKIPSARSALEWKLRRNRARCSSIFATVSS